MTGSFTRILVVTMMMLAFLSQGFTAVSMSCDMTQNDHSSHAIVMQDNMHHQMMSAHSMADMNMSQGGECCDSDCKCPEQACQSITLFYSQYLVLHSNPSSEKIPSVDVNQRQFTSQSLYRPPITA